MLPDDTFFLPISELAPRLRRRELSPVELAAGYLERLETVGKRLGAVATVMRETALGEAREAEREIRRGRWRGALHGVPYGAKDLLATREAPTTWGAAPYKDQGQYQTAGIITKEIGGVAKEHKFIRADRHASYDDAVEFSLGKARQIADQQGDRMFG